MSEQGVVSIQPHERVVLAAVTRKSLDGITSGRLESEVSAASAQEPGKVVVLDMSKVDFVPSVALGSILRLAQDLKFFGRRLIVVGVTSQVRRTMSVTRLDKVLELRATLADALDAVAKPS